MVTPYDFPGDTIYDFPGYDPYDLPGLTPVNGPGITPYDKQPLQVIGNNFNTGSGANPTVGGRTHKVGNAVVIMLANYTGGTGNFDLTSVASTQAVNWQSPVNHPAANLPGVTISVILGQILSTGSNLYTLSITGASSNFQVVEFEVEGYPSWSLANLSFADVSVSPLTLAAQSGNGLLVGLGRCVGGSSLVIPGGYESSIPSVNAVGIIGPPGQGAPSFGISVSDPGSGFTALLTG